MTKQELIRKMFPNKNNSQLSKIWNRIIDFETTLISFEMTGVGGYKIDIFKFEEFLIEEFGYFEISIKEFCEQNFGKELTNEILK